MTGFIKDSGGTWRSINKLSVNTGTWVNAKAAWSNTGGVWQKWYSLGPTPGESTFTTPGSYTFVVPPGVEQVSAVVVGGGGQAGRSGSNVGAGGGGGGGLSYGTFSVTPGESITVQVGAGGDGGSSTGGSGGDSFVSRGSTQLLLGGGGAGGLRSTSSAAGGAGGSSGGTERDGGGLGGRGGGGRNNNCGGAGGGAGGYSGNGGNGASGNSPSGGTSGSGGAGAGGSSNSGQAFGGGGVGILGSGESGIYNTNSGGQGGSFGANGLTDRTAGLFGGGGGAEEDDTPSNGAPGAQGAVRIIWGEGRQYPFNAGNGIFIGSYEETVSSTSYSFTTDSIPTGFVAVTVGWEGGAEISSASIGGVAATIDQDTSSSGRSAIIYTTNSNPSTNSVVVNFAATPLRAAIGVYWMPLGTTFRSSSDVYTGNSNSFSVSNSLLSGFYIASFAEGNPRSIDWTGGDFSESFQTTTAENNSLFSSAFLDVNSSGSYNLAFDLTSTISGWSVKYWRFSY